MNLDPEIFGTAKPCAIAGCQNEAARGRAGLCEAHRTRKERGVPLDRPLRTYTKQDQPRRCCSATHCYRTVVLRELCSAHYHRRYRQKRPDWDRPIAPRRPKGQSKRVEAYIRKAYVERLARQAEGLSRTLSQHVRAILDEHCERMRGDR